MQEPMYIIQKPMSAKGKCVNCKMVFPDDELRLGFRETPAAIEKGPWKWNHVTCVPVDRWDTAEDVYGEVDEIPGVATTEIPTARSHPCTRLGLGSLLLVVTVRATAAVLWICVCGGGYRFWLTLCV